MRNMRRNRLITESSHACTLPTRSVRGRTLRLIFRAGDRINIRGDADDRHLAVEALAETQGDRDLRAYGTLVIDEAHERSLNIDFLLGYLKRLLERRSDLKLVITSATIDADKFSRHFGGAPVLEISGRLHPVELRYRPVGGDQEDTTREEEERALADAVAEALREGPGDVLVFLPGEREIREAAEVLRRNVRGAELLPLYARLTAAEQDRVFRPGEARRVVLATNVAETSLTVPRIRYVVDTGLARVRRYSYRNKVEQLRVEPISQAAARQRAGRCGRVSDGVCFRLYSEEEFAARPAYTDPEILRSSLAGVILRALSLGLGKVEDFLVAGREMDVYLGVASLAATG